MERANIIEFPNSTHQEDAEPEQVGRRLTRIAEQFLTPIQGTEKAAAKRILAQLKLPEESADFLRYNEYLLLRDAASQHCEKCKGNRPNCDQIIYGVNEDGKIFVELKHCAKRQTYETEQKAQEIIRKACIPKIFAGKRASEFESSNTEVLDAAEAAIFDGKSVYIFGEVGTGKTLLASIIATERAYLGKSSLFISVAETLETLREFNNQTQKFTDSKTREDKLHKFASAKCLIVDDIGAEKPTEWACETLFKIFNRRYNDCLQNVSTSNLSPAALEKHLGTRIARRILHGAEIVELK